MSLSLPMNASDLHREVRINFTTLQTLAEAAYDQWTALHGNAKRKPYRSLPDHEKEKYELVVLAVVGTSRALTSQMSNAA